MTRLVVAGPRAATVGTVLAHDYSARDRAAATAVILHPHPDMGGDRHHPVVDELYRGLPLHTLRFDFTSSSIAVAQADVAAALELVPDGPVVLMGYSFGADIALTVTDPRVVAWFAVAPPLRVVDPSEMGAAADPRPKLLAVPERDQYSPPTRAVELTADWLAPTVVPISGADHFLVGRAGAVLTIALDWLPSVVAGL